VRENQSHPKERSALGWLQEFPQESPHQVEKGQLYRHASNRVIVNLIVLLESRRSYDGKSSVRMKGNLVALGKYPTFDKRRITRAYNFKNCKTWGPLRVHRWGAQRLRNLVNGTHSVQTLTYWQFYKIVFPAGRLCCPTRRLARS
jgi:hypothetical protein